MSGSFRAFAGLFFGSLFLTICIASAVAWLLAPGLSATGFGNVGSLMQGVLGSAISLAGAFVAISLAYLANRSVSQQLEIDVFRFSSEKFEEATRPFLKLQSALNNLCDYIGRARSDFAVFNNALVDAMSAGEQRDTSYLTEGTDAFLSFAESQGLSSSEATQLAQQIDRVWTVFNGLAAHFQTIGQCLQEIEKSTYATLFWRNLVENAPRTFIARASNLLRSDIDWSRPPHYRQIQFYASLFAQRASALTEDAALKRWALPLACFAQHLSILTKFDGSKLFDFREHHSEEDVRYYLFFLTVSGLLGTVSEVDDQNGTVTEIAVGAYLLLDFIEIVSDSQRISNSLNWLSESLGLGHARVARIVALLKNVVIGYRSEFTTKFRAVSERFPDAAFFIADLGPGRKPVIATAR